MQNSHYHLILSQAHFIVMVRLLEEKQHNNKSKHKLKYHTKTSDSLIYLVQNQIVLSPVLKVVLIVMPLPREEEEEKEEEEEGLVCRAEDSVSFLAQTRTILALALLSALTVVSLLSLVAKSQ